MNELTTTTELQKITTGLESFEQRKQSLIDLAESAEHLAIESIGDTEGIKAVSTKRKELKSARVQIEKEGKSMRDLITPISKHISAKEKELLSIILPHEERLYAREQWVEKEIEKIQQEKEAEEKARIQQRIDQLAKYNVAIDYVMCLGLTDEQFEKKLSVAKSEFEAEQKRIEEENNRIAAEKKKEEERLKKQKEDQEKEEKRIAIMPDKTKLIQFAASLALIPVQEPELKTVEAQQILSEAIDRIKSIAAYVKKQCDSL